MSDRIEVQKPIKPTLVDLSPAVSQVIIIKSSIAKVTFWLMHAVAPEKISEMLF